MGGVRLREDFAVFYQKCAKITTVDPRSIRTPHLRTVSFHCHNYFFVKMSALVFVSTKHVSGTFSRRASVTWTLDNMGTLILALVCPFAVRIKAGVYLKMSGKSDFLFSLELASSTIGLRTSKSCFKVFSKFSFERAVCLQEVYELLLVAMATELVFCLVFSLVYGFAYPPRIFKTLFLRM